MKTKIFLITFLVFLFGVTSVLGVVTFSVDSEQLISGKQANVKVLMNPESSESVANIRFLLTTDSGFEFSSTSATRGDLTQNADPFNCNPVQSDPTHKFLCNIGKSSGISSSGVLASFSGTSVGASGTNVLFSLSGLLAQDTSAISYTTSSTPSTFTIVAACTDECTSGTTQCSGSGKVQTCGNYDGDSCLEWGGDTDCNDGQICSAGVCTNPPATCPDGTCNEDARSCRADCGNAENDVCTGDLDCASNLDCILVRGNQHKCKNLDNGKALTLSSTLGEIENTLKRATSLSQSLPSIAGELRSTALGESVTFAAQCGECSGWGLDCIPRKTGKGYTCADLDGTDDPTQELSDSDGSLGKIKAILKAEADSPYNSKSFIQRLALLAKEFNDLFK